MIRIFSNSSHSNGWLMIFMDLRTRNWTLHTHYTAVSSIFKRYKTQQNGQAAQLFIVTIDLFSQENYVNTTGKSQDESQSCQVRHWRAAEMKHKENRFGRSVRRWRLLLCCELSKGSIHLHTLHCAQRMQFSLNEIVSFEKNLKINWSKF